ncbi:hypothetical protein JKP88DRAFT_263640 [Tribonema minus]|uniref:JAB1/MPN/MOV34 metalloenzyme domain-containing protein n=1 Tax=Tribonema minus TaxID=303371 RepID=A0A835YT38_9STRA|nr:hypothetical protein JKP88DRAFT_263640 [Tribonema minus]
MEVEDAAATAAAEGAEESKSAGDGQLSIHLHPLAIITISDHYTRVSTGGGVPPRDAKILGVLFGERSGAEIGIYDASEIGYDVVGGEIVLSQASVAKQVELYEAVYPTYKVLGWYSVGLEPCPSDIKLQQQMKTHCANPIFVLLDPEPPKDAKALPVTVYQSEDQAGGGGAAATVFVQGSFQLQTVQAEQIGMEHVARSTPAEGSSAIERHATTMTTSLTALASRLAVLRRYLVAVRGGDVPADHKLLRQITAVTSELRAMGNASGSGGGDAALSEALARDRCDALAVTALAALQKGAAAMDAAAHKFNLAHSDKPRTGGGGGPRGGAGL